MADSKLSELTSEKTTLSATDRLYLSDGTDRFVTALTLKSLTGDVTAGVDGVTNIGASKVGTAEIADQAVTLAKMVNMDTDHLIVRQTAGTGSPEHKKVSELDALGSPASGDYVLGQSVAGNIGYFTIGNINSATGKSINAQTGTTYTTVAGDANNMVTLSNASAITCTIPSATYSAGDQIDFIQLGAGQVTFAGSGVTISTPETLKLEKQYAAATITFLSASTAVLSGQLELAP